MKFYLLGIGGTGMSALAGLLKSAGHEVCGSDQTLYHPVNEILDRLQIKYFAGYNQDNLLKSPAEVYVIGNIISRGNPEAEYILNNRLPYLSMPEALYQFVLQKKTTVAVAGTYGKTTTAALLAFLMQKTGYDCGFFIGGKLLNFDLNFHSGKEDIFVIEADEYETAFFDKSAKFFKYRPYHLILNPLEHDHLDLYQSEEEYLRAFRYLIRQLPGQGAVVYPLNNQNCRKVLAASPAKSIAYGSSGEICAEIIHFDNNGSDFVFRYGKKSWPARINLPGEHNVWNCVAALTMLLTIGFEAKAEQLLEALKDFKGVARRMEFIGAIGNTHFYEDFAHHPASLKTVIAEFKRSFPEKRVVVFFEPRSWTLRLNYYFEQIRAALQPADEIWILDVFEKEKIVGQKPLDVEKLVEELNACGGSARNFSSYQQLKENILKRDFSESAVAVFISNGSFGGLPLFFKELAAKKSAV